eukprot:1159924-Pelagomonas_calceolata.AAC.4
MAATQGQAALLHQNGSLMRLLTGKNVGKKISTASRSRQEGRKAAQVQGYIGTPRGPSSAVPAVAACFSVGFDAYAIHGVNDA